MKGLPRWQPFLFDLGVFGELGEEFAGAGVTVVEGAAELARYS
jgi:hypothetical protein